MMAVPLLHDERALGVLEVLDRPARAQFSLVEMDLLGLFANQAAIALDLLRRARKAEAALDASGEAAGVVARLAETVEKLDDERREAGLRLLASLEEVLRNDEGG
jgi:GAF domain-containing protein